MLLPPSDSKNLNDFTFSSPCMSRRLFPSVLVARRLFPSVLVARRLLNAVEQERKRCKL